MAWKDLRDASSLRFPSTRAMLNEQQAGQSNRDSWLLVTAVALLGKVNVRNRHRETPLLLAVRADAVDIVSVLLGFGARLDDPDVNGEAAFPLLAR